MLSSLLVLILPFVVWSECREGLISRSGSGDVTSLGQAAIIEIDVTDFLERAEGGAIQRVALTAEVRGDFAHGSANLSSLDTTLLCSPSRSQCGAYDTCISSNGASTAIAQTPILDSIVQVLFTTSVEVDFDFCPRGILAQAIVTLTATITCPSPTPAPVRSPTVDTITSTDASSSKNSNNASMRRFNRIVGFIVLVCLLLMALISAIIFLFIRYSKCKCRKKESSSHTTQQERTGTTSPSASSSSSSAEWRRPLSGPAKVRDNSLQLTSTQD